MIAFKNYKDLKDYIMSVYEVERLVYVQHQVLENIKEKCNWEKKKMNVEEIPMPQFLPRQDPDSGIGNYLAGIVASLLLAYFFVCPVLMTIFRSGEKWTPESADAWKSWTVVAFIICRVVHWIRKSSRDRQAEAEYQGKCQQQRNQVNMQNQAIQTDKVKAARKIQLMTAQINYWTTLYQQTLRIRNQLYALDVIYPSYRNFVAVASFAQYFDSRRCSKLTGHEGAYNLYEIEAKLKKLDDILRSLNQIKQNQYVLYQAIQRGNTEISMLSNSVNYAIDRLEAPESNTSIARYNQQIIQKNQQLEMLCSTYRTKEMYRY